MSCTSSPREAKSVATRMRTRPANHASCEWAAAKQSNIPVVPIDGADGPFAKSYCSSSGSHTVFEVLEGFFAVALLVASVQTLHSEPLQTHVAGQVVSADISMSEDTKRTTQTVRQSQCERASTMMRQGEKIRNSHNFFSNKDENFVLRQHAPNEVQQIRLFLLFVDDQHRLLHRVHSLQHHMRDGRKSCSTSNAMHYFNICNIFLKAERLFRAYSL